MAQQGFLAEVRLFAGNFAPRGWALCEGQLLSIAQNTALFSLLGTIYGGDGRTTFALPDLRGRVPISPGTGPGLPTYREGTRSGQAEHVLNFLEMPSHSHLNTVQMTGGFAVGTNANPAGSGEPAGNVLGESSSGVYNSNAAEAGEELGGVNNTKNITVQLANTGGTQAHNNMQPYLSINHIIAIQGTFPSRS